MVRILNSYQIPHSHQRLFAFDVFWSQSLLSAVYSKKSLISTIGARRGSLSDDKQWIVRNNKHIFISRYSNKEPDNYGPSEGGRFTLVPFPTSKSQCLYSGSQMSYEPWNTVHPSVANPSPFYAPLGE